MPHPTQHALVRHPESNALIALELFKNYDEDDPIVTGYPWAFEAALDLIPEGAVVEDGVVTEVAVPVVKQAPAKKAPRKRTRG